MKFFTLILFSNILFTQSTDDSIMELKRFPRQNAKKKDYIWPNAIIPYRIHKSHYTHDHVKQIEKAMKLLQNVTCVRFIEHTNEYDFITITGDSYHCGTKIGRRGAEQILSILNDTVNEGCLRTMSIVHELLHVIGFHHIHIGADRDDYIKILWDNVLPDKKKKFAIKNDLQDLDVEYDYSSLMHYSEYAYSKNGEKTIIPLKDLNGATLGQRNHLSKKDILKVNRLYDCDFENIIDDQ